MLEPLDASRLPPAPDGRLAAEDFIDGGLLPCGIGSEAYSLVFAYDRERLRDGPTRIQDFFDLKKYPGKRGMRRAVIENLEMALVADGVPVERVYDVLRTPAGVDAAFAKLDTIREHVLWWEDSGEAPRLLADGEVVMTTAYNGRIFDAIAAEGKPFRIVWDAQVYKLAYHVIPRGAPQKELAMELIAFATSTEVAADQYSWIPYMPLRQSAMERIGAYHMDPDLNMWPYMPLVPENTQNAVRWTRNSGWSARLRWSSAFTPGWSASRCPRPRPPSAAAPVLADDGTPLPKKLARAMLVRRLRAAGLVAPLLAFLLAAFIVPVGAFLMQGVYDDTYAAHMPASTPLLQAWDAAEAPSEALAAALVRDLVAAREARTIGRVATRLNRQHAGLRSLLTSTARKAQRLQAPYLPALAALHRGWSEPETWRALKVVAARYTPAYLAVALDLRYEADGGFRRQDESRRIHLSLLLRTLWISVLVTLACLVLGYPSPICWRACRRRAPTCC